MVIRVAVVGATGRMGRLAQRLIDESDDLALHAAISSKDSLDALAGADVVFDVTVPAVSPGIVNAALDRGIPVLVGTSGWTAERITTLRRRVQDAAPGVVIIPNFSLGSALATAFSVLAAPWFDFIEIVESHHAGKVDSPSGTAIRTAELIGEARANVGPVAAPHADQRARGQQVASVPIHSLRHDGLSARQEVVFGGTGETLRLVHDTHSDASYEAGILLGLRAAANTEGVIVGLDRLLDLGLPR
ncbi:MAG TPA: 4-hydroxy-tetrahydrodipicolinate reductase [Pseudolysinimonas sp.]|jgi:4-hydroxy-tetrahydrodipicolinate reductase|nr:4-hydroxy-tetrahydrodipicolinate reductase [Pseudolysinimonas sp.]